MLDDAGAPALPYVELYSLTGREDYLDLAGEMVEYVRYGQERLQGGTFSRPEPVDGSVWADDLFMASYLLFKYNEVSPDPGFIDDCVNQVTQIHGYLWAVLPWANGS